MPHEYKIQRRVEFSETDAAGIVHFSNFFRYMEACEHAMFRSLGLSVDLVVDGVHYSLPRVNASCTYVAPLRFEDEFEVRLLVRQIRTRSLINDYVFTKLDGVEPQCVAHGSITIVSTVKDETGALKAIEFPKDVARLLQPAPKGLFAELTRPGANSSADGQSENG